jgi:DNA adenine methylase
MKTILRYAGGKTRAIKKITPFVEDYQTIVSPFIGGGSLEVHWAHKGHEVIGADIFDILVTFWQQLLANPQGVADTMRKINPTAEEYKKVKEELMCTPEVQQMLAGWKTDFYHRDPAALDDLTLAAYYYFNHNCSYGPGFLGWASKLYLKDKSWNKMITNVENFKCPSLRVVHQDFETTIQESPGEFLYLDPPYYLEKEEDNKMFAGIYPMRNIPVHHNDFDHEKLRDLLLNHDGDFVLSYNNCETIRNYYSDFEFYYPEWFYSMGQGETRIGKNRQASESHVKESHEILIVKRSSSLKKVDTSVLYDKVKA